MVIGVHFLILIKRASKHHRAQTYNFLILILSDHFRPLKKFVNDKRRLAAELLDSVDLETLYEIFPELEVFDCNELYNVNRIFIHLRKKLMLKRAKLFMMFFVECL